MCVYVCVSVHARTFVEVRGQLVEVNSLLPCGVQGFNSTCQQKLLPAKHLLLEFKSNVFPISVISKAVALALYHLQRELPLRDN